MLLQNKVAVITGSGRGIGRAIAELFAREGASVFLSARTDAQLAATDNAIRSTGGKSAYFAADLAQEAACSRLVATARERFGGVDILVNNAGHYGPVAPVEDYPLDAFGDVLPGLQAGASQSTPALLHRR